jgi:hypothetical protein
MSEEINEFDSEDELEGVEDFEDEFVGDDIVIEIDDDIESETEIVDNFVEDKKVLDETPEDPKTEVIFSKHTINRKHSLNYDSIFKGKKDNPLSEDEIDFSTQYNETFEVDKSSIYWYESVDNENYTKEKRIKEKVYAVLAEYTDINFLNNRRKPSRVDFNQFYYLLKTNLQDENFSNVEIFNELAVYFSDNLFNMFKLLDNKWRNQIIQELQEHIGKQPYSKEVMNRNIHLGTEIEFLGCDVNEDTQIHITGVVIETDYEESTFKIDSYERIYEIHISEITKILNNTKFRYNLNKLNNIDFL